MTDRPAQEPRPPSERDAAEWHRYLHAEGILLDDDGDECGPWHHRVFSAPPAAPLDVERLRRIVEALGGFLWMGNNLHNSGSEMFRELYGHAMVDARAIYEELNAEYARLAGEPTDD